jgi:RNA polymerase sigma-70 factor (ECF subfamily)
VPDPALDDEALVGLARDGQDRQAFGLLYDRYQERVYRYCYRRLGTKELAEDAMSQAFTRALTALPRYRQQSFRSWLFAIAHNVVVDAQRSTRATRPEEDAAEIVDPTPTPEQVALAGESDRLVLILLSELPADQRRVMELRLAWLNDREIGEVLGKSRGAVRVLQHRAIVRLRSSLGIDANPEEATNAEG